MFHDINRSPYYKVYVHAVTIHGMYTVTVYIPKEPQMGP